MSFWGYLHSFCMVLDKLQILSTLKYSHCDQGEEHRLEGKLQICGEEGDKYTKFQVIMRPDNVYGFFNKESGHYICRGTMDSRDSFLVAKDSFDINECWLQIHDLSPLMQLELEDFELYFTTNYVSPLTAIVC